MANDLISRLRRMELPHVETPISEAIERIAELEAELTHAMEQWRLFREDNEGLRKARDEWMKEAETASGQRDDLQRRLDNFYCERCGCEECLRREQGLNRDE